MTKVKEIDKRKANQKKEEEGVAAKEEEPTKLGPYAPKAQGSHQV